MVSFQIGQYDYASLAKALALLERCGVTDESSRRNIARDCWRAAITAEGDIARQAQTGTDTQFVSKVRAIAKRAKHLKQEMLELDGSELFLASSDSKLAEYLNTDAVYSEGTLTALTAIADGAESLAQSFDSGMLSTARARKPESRWRAAARMRQLIEGAGGNASATANTDLESRSPFSELVALVIQVVSGEAVSDAELNKIVRRTRDGTTKG